MWWVSDQVSSSMCAYVQFRKEDKLIKLSLNFGSRQLFFFHLNLSFRSKYWLQSVIVIEKWNNPRIDRFPIRLASTSSRQRKRHCFPRSPPPGKSGTTGATVETLKKPHWWRRQSVETEVQQEWTDGHSLDGDLRCCVKVSSQADMCLSFPRGVQTVLKNRQSFY